MRATFFALPGRFYKGNLHTHSTRSDGGRAPEEVIAAYRAAGYNFLALTDHFLPRYDFPIVDTTMWRDAAFTTLFGAELHAPALENGEPWHILAVGLPLDFAPTTAEESGPALAARAAAAGAFVGIAHPAWYALSLADALTLDAAHAVEVYNTTCELEADRGESWHLTDVLLERGRRLLAYAADDAHFTEFADGFGGWVQVRAPLARPRRAPGGAEGGALLFESGAGIARSADRRWDAARRLLAGRCAAPDRSRRAGGCRCAAPR